MVAGAPLLGIHDLVNQHTAGGVPFNPDEALTAEQALRAFTLGSAYAVHEEHVKGTLARGMLADFTVLSDDLLAVPPHRIKDIEVTATVIGGTVVGLQTGLPNRHFFQTTVERVLGQPIPRISVPGYDFGTVAAD